MTANQRSRHVSENPAGPRRHQEAAVLSRGDRRFPRAAGRPLHRAIRSFQSAGGERRQGSPQARPRKNQGFARQGRNPDRPRAAISRRGGRDEASRAQQPKQSPAEEKGAGTRGGRGGRSKWQRRAGPGGPGPGGPGPGDRSSGGRGCRKLSLIMGTRPPSRSEPSPLTGEGRPSRSRRGRGEGSSRAEYPSRRLAPKALATPLPQGEAGRVWV